MKTISSVDDYIASHTHFNEELTLLRELLCSTELDETLKWSAPVYTLHGKNVVGLGAFKHHFGLWFFNGVYLKDQHNLLINAQENKTKALRQIRFQSKTDIKPSLILDYVNEAIENQRLGLELKPKRKTTSIQIPEALQAAFETDKTLKQAFDALTPGKQREYCEHVSSAKREATKTARLEKITPLILQGKGLYDKYKNC